MQHESSPGAGREAAGGPAGPLCGARGWLISDGRAGNDVQARGVAEALGLDYEMKRVAVPRVRRMLAPWLPLEPGEGVGAPGGAFAPPWPDVVIAIGWASTPYLRAIRRLAGPSTFRVVLLDNKAGRRLADLVWVPEHDPLRGINVVTTPTAPHGFSPRRLAELRSRMPAAIAALPAPRVAVMLGGRNGRYSYAAGDHDRLAAALASLGRLGAGFMITPSRRSHAELLAAADAGTRGFARILFDGAGENPYPQFLAHADLFLVTADSVNMTGEAASTGKPVYVFVPSGGGDKFTRFHAALARAGVTRVCPQAFAALDAWTYAPLDAAGTIAAEIERRWLNRRRVLGGAEAR